MIRCIFCLNPDVSRAAQNEVRTHPVLAMSALNAVLSFDRGEVRRTAIRAAFTAPCVVYYDDSATGRGQSAQVAHNFGHNATLRHTYRAWLDPVGTPIAVQQKLMRHASITTTMNTYGDVVTDEMSQAHAKVVGLALPKTERIV